MKKTAKTLLATLLALTMLCALALPVWADTTKEDLSTHTFKVYQIFKGTYDATSGKLSNIEWGDGVKSADLLSELKGDATLWDSFLNATTARDVAEVMKDWKDSDEKSIAFARIVYKNKIASKATPFSGTSFTAKEAGYYLIVDNTTSNTYSYVAKNFSILKVLDPNTPYTIESKAVKPTVEKFVKNRNGDWAKYADYALGDEIEFKLVATLPASSAYDFYDRYAFFFQDVLTAGFTYDSGASVDKVTIAAGTGTAVGSAVVLDPNKYTLDLSNVANTTIPSFTVTIPNAKMADATITSETLKNEGATIEVHYRAHLNTKAAITTYLAAPQSTKNTTDVQLFYCNDPHDSTSRDITPPDNVYVFTYGLEYTKYADKAEDANRLGGAGFELHNAAGAMTFTGSDVTYTYSKTSTNTTTTLLSSDTAATRGQFKVNGLAAGTYTLKETLTPAGYNTCADLPVVIKPAYTLAADGTVTVDLSKSPSMSQNIINQSGVVLPSTGGMGTTLFYVVGGLLMVGAAVLLVTKKRMQKN